MAEQIGYEFTSDDRQLLAALNRFEKNLEETRAEARKLSVDTGKAFKDITSNIDKAEKKSIGFKQVFGGIIAATLVQQSIRAVRSLGNEAIRGAASYEQLQISFTTFLQSSEKANALLEQLTKTAASTPFEQEEIFNGARQLLAYGLEAEKINDILITLGDAAAGVGQPLQRVVTIFGQIQSKGRLTGEELKQLREAGINPLREIAELLNVAEAEVEGLITKGKVSADVVTQAFQLMSAEGGRFANLMEEQSKSFEGTVSNFRDQVAITLRQIGTELLPILKEAVKDGTAFLQSLDPEKIASFARGLIDFVKGLFQVAKTLAIITAGYIAAAAATQLYDLWTKRAIATTKIFNTVAKANPIGILVAGLAVAIPKLTAFTKELTGTTRGMQEMMKASEEAGEQYGNEAREADKLISTLTSLTASDVERQKAIDELQSKYPDIFAKYDIEGGKIGELIAFQKDLKTSILEATKARLKQQAFEEFATEKIRLQEKIDKGPGLVETLLFGGAGAKVLQLGTKKALKDIDKDFNETISRIDNLELGIEIPITTTQESLDEHIQGLKTTRDELSKLSTQELREITRKKEAVDKSFTGPIQQNDKLIAQEKIRKDIALDILKRREKEASANQGNKKEIEAARKALESYRKEVEKIATDLQKSGIGQITDPIKKAQAEQEFALSQSKNLFDELRTEAKKLGQDITDIDDLEKQARLQINVEYYQKLDELRQEAAEKELSDFLNTQRLISDAQKRDIESSTSGQGFNTGDEIARVKILEAELQTLSLAAGEIADTFGSSSNEFLDAQNEFNQKLFEIDEARASNAVSALQREEQILLQEADLITKSGDNLLTLEQFKEQTRLKIQLEFAKKRLELIQAQGEGDDSPEVRQLKSVIAGFENELNAFGQGTIFDKIKSKIADLFKIDVSTLNQSIALFGQAFGQIQNIVAESTQFQIAQQQELLDATRERISQTEEELAKEIEDQKNGYAANVQSKKEELEQLRAEEAAHKEALLKEQKAALKQQLIADSLSQISSLVTTVANVTEANSKLPAPIAIPLVLSTIATFFAVFKKFKAQSKQLAGQALFTGGRIPETGRTDKHGARGHKIEGTNLRVGRGEWVVNDETSDIHNDFLRDLNAGKYDHLNLDKIVKGEHKRGKIKPIGIGRDLAELAQKSQVDDAIAKHQYEHTLRVETMKAAFSGEVSRLIQYMEQEEKYIPWTEGQKGIIIKKKGHTIKHKMS